MIQNYLKLAWRNLWKHKTDAAINFLGLCLAFACALLLFLSVYYEFSFDKFHKNARNIYHVYFANSTPKEVRTNAAMPVPLAPALLRAYPEIKYAVRYINSSGVVRYKGKKLNESLKLTDPDFFRMFSFPFAKGNTATALNGLNNVVLRESTAKAIFDQEDPMGKLIEIQVDGEWKPFTVTGVTEDLPDNSSIAYDAVIRFEQDGEYASNTSRWDNWNHDVYLQLQDGVKASDLEKKTASLISANFQEDIDHLKRDGALPFPDGSYMQLHLQPLSDIHTDTKISAEGGAISRSYLYLLLTVGCLILLIACINFINLSIGRAFTRTHEIGLRKTLGARPYQLIGQLWSEAFLICLFAFLAGAGLCYWLLPQYQQLFGMNIHRALLHDPLVWISVLVAFLFITLIAGGYPAWLMSRLNVIRILKGKVSIGRSGRLRNGLIVVQFSIAILLIIATLVAWQQIGYLRSRPLGYNRNQVVSIPVEGEMDRTSMVEIMRTKLSAYPAIESVSGIYNNFGRGLDHSSRHSVMGFDYENRNISTVWMGISYDFVKTLDLSMAAGRDFSKDFPTDSNGIVINEAMAEQIGEKNPLGVLLPVREDLPPKKVIGVVKNFNFESLRDKIEPISLVFRIALSHQLYPGEDKTG
jgi:putative ABC transport system permease protein